MKWALRGVLMAAALGFGAGCSGSVESTPQGADETPTAGRGNDDAAQPEAQAGAGGSAGGSETPSAGGPPGAGGGAPVSICPAVIRYTTANIRADFELSDADAQHALYVCRNSECYTGHLDQGRFSMDTFNTQVSVAVLEESGSKYILLQWRVLPDPSDYDLVDTYQLSFSTVPEASPAILIDTQVRYVKTVDTLSTAGVPHPELCGSWGEANVDLRKGKAAP